MSTVTLKPGDLFITSSDNVLYICLTHTPGIGIIAMQATGRNKVLFPTGTDINRLDAIEERSKALLEVINNGGNV